MGGFKSKVTKMDKTDKLFKALNYVASQDVLIGLPQETSSRKKGEITNAELAYIHSHGAAMHNIPPRPFLEPAIEANINPIIEIQKKGLQGALAFKPNEIKSAMKALGLFGQSAVKDWFTDPRNNWAPNAPATIHRKGSDRPLIDTGQLRNAITYVIRPKNATP